MICIDPEGFLSRCFLIGFDNNKKEEKLRGYHRNTGLIAIFLTWWIVLITKNFDFYCHHILSSEPESLQAYNLFTLQTYQDFGKR